MHDAIVTGATDQAHAGRRRCAWRLGTAVVVLAVTLWLGPLAEHSGSDMLFAGTILAGLVLVATAASGRPAFGLVAGCFPVLLLVAAGRIKFQYLSTPLLAPDLMYDLNAEVAQTLLRYPFILTAIALALTLAPLLLVWLWRAERRPRPEFRAARVGATLLGLAVLGISLYPRGPFAREYDKGMWLAMNDRSFISDFLISFHATRPTLPAFTPDDASRNDWHDLPAATGMVRGGRRPDIVAVLEESTFDPRMLTACTSRLCDARMFHADADTIAHGWLAVHTWGGGTWTSEFAFLTGLPHTWFGPAGLYAPFNLAPRIRYTLPRLLDAQGYRTIGIYPTDGDFMNGRDAYTDYGFDAFYGGRQLGLGWGTSDARVFAAFEKVFAAEKRKAHGKPLFVFVLTLRQHGPHMTPLGRLPAPYNKPAFPGKLAPGDPALDRWLNLNLTNYLHRLSLSDAAMTRLEAFLRRDDRAALLLHFGDHQPSFDGAINQLAKTLPATVPDPQYTTYYVLKGFNMPVAREHYPTLDIAYLGSLLLDAAGAPRNPFFTANTLLRDRCHGETEACGSPALLGSYNAWIFGRLGDLR